MSTTHSILDNLSGMAATTQPARGSRYTIHRSEWGAARVMRWEDAEAAAENAASDSRIERVSASHPLVIAAIGAGLDVQACRADRYLPAHVVRAVEEG